MCNLQNLEYFMRTQNCDKFQFDMLAYIKFFIPNPMICLDHDKTINDTLKKYYDQIPNSVSLS